MSVGCANSRGKLAGWRVRASKLDRFVQLAALGTAGAVHVGVVGVNQTAFLAAENPVLTLAGPEAPPPHLAIDGQRHQAAQQQRHVTEDKRLGRHSVVARTLLVGASICHSKMSVATVSRDVLPTGANFIPATVFIAS